MADIDLVPPGGSCHIFTHNPDHLTQVQHKGDRVDIVDHFDKGPDPVDLHIIHKINRSGGIDVDIE